MFRNHRWVWISLCLLVGILFAIKLMVFNSYSTPPSNDVGNHLTILHAFLGNDVTGLDLAHRNPPLYFFLVLAPLLKILPTFTAIKVSMALVSAIMAIPFFFLMRRIIKDDAVSLLAAGLFAFGPGFSDMVCWGAMPNLFAIFVMLWSIYFLLCALETGSKRDALFSGVFLSLTVGSHLVTAPYYIVSLVLLGLWLLASKRREAFPQIKVLLLMGMAGALLSLPYLWTTYLAPLREGYLFPRFGASSTVAGVDITAVVRYVYRYLIFLWLPIVILGLVWVWKRFKDKLIPILITSLIMSSIILSYLYGEEGGRLFYFLQVPVFLILGIIFLALKKGVIRAKSKRKLVYGALLLIPLIAVPMVSVGQSYNRLTDREKFYHVLSNEAADALDYLKENTPLDATVISNDAYLSWWVEGYAERKCYQPYSPEYEQYTSEEERWRGEFATKAMAGNSIVDNAYLRVADFFPSSPCNPRIIIYQKDKYEEFLYFDDDCAVVEFENGQTAPLSSAPKKEMERDITIEKASINYHYAWDYANVTRTVQVTAAPEVTINYMANNYSKINYFATLVRMAPGTKIEKYNIAGDGVTIAWRDRFGRISNATLEMTSEGLSHIDFMPGDGSVNSMPGFYFSFTKMPCTILVKVDGEFPRSSGIEYYDGAELIKEYVDYILVSKVEVAEPRGLYRDVYRFDLDPRFEKVFENNGCLIFRVLK